MPPDGSALPTLRGLSRFATIRVAMALVIVLGAMAGLALLAEAMNSGGGTVYLADLRQAENGAAGGVPSLSVAGLGRATAPAERASLQLMFSVDPNQYYNNPGGPIEQQGTPSPSSEAEEAARPIVAAVTAAGAPADAVTVVTSGAFRSEFYGPGGPDAVSFRIDLVFPDPQLEDVSAIIDAAQMAGREMNLLLSPVGVSYGVADCAPLQATAWEAAVADAEARAAAQAERLGVRLGSVVAASEASPDEAGSLLDAESRTGNCVAEAPPLLGLYGLNQGNVTLPPFDPARAAEVVAVASVTVSYAIETE